ncbi:MAG: hypothetical protein GEU71_08855 [Actinobacteria bacterium]|nr:hypothetical protein [Actinomycetota bacterium]
MKRHPFDPISLVGGLLFSALGVALFAGGIDLTAEGTRWIWPAGFIALGLAVLATIRPTPTADVTPVPEETRAQEDDETSSLDD